MNLMFNVVLILLERNKRDADDPRKEVPSSLKMWIGIGGSILVGSALVIILILHLACQLKVGLVIFIPARYINNMDQSRLYHDKDPEYVFSQFYVQGQDAVGGCYYRNPTVGSINATWTIGPTTPTSPSTTKDTFN